MSDDLATARQRIRDEECHEVSTLITAETLRTLLAEQDSRPPGMEAPAYWAAAIAGALRGIAFFHVAHTDKASLANARAVFMGSARLEIDIALARRVDNTLDLEVFALDGNDGEPIEGAQRGDALIVNACDGEGCDCGQVHIGMMREGQLAAYVSCGPDTARAFAQQASECASAAQAKTEGGGRA